jgi:hypothetical protein
VQYKEIGPLAWDDGISMPLIVCEFYEDCQSVKRLYDSADLPPRKPLTGTIREQSHYVEYSRPHVLT